MSGGSVLDRALELCAERGLPLVPCSGNKVPLQKNWTGFENRSIDQVESAFSAPGVELIGVRTGRVSNLLVIDIDPRNGGDDWYAANFEKLNCKRLHQTRSGGLHLLYTMPEQEIGNPGNKFGPGVDVRGNGGQIIWWPAHDFDVLIDEEPGPAPDWLVEALTARPKVNGQDHQREVGHQAGRTLGEGGRNSTLASFAGRLRRDGLSPAELATALLSVNQRLWVDPLADAEVGRIAKSVGRYEPKPESEAPGPVHVRRWINWPSLIDQIPRDRIWHMDHWLTGGPTLCAGRGGIGKTLLWQQAGTHLALGRSYFDTVSAPLKVLMWACEDDHDELWRRQRDICRHLNINLADLGGKLTIDARLGLDNTLFSVAYGRPAWTSLRDELRDQVNDTQADVLVIDNIGQTFGGNENDRHHVTSYVNGLVGLRPGIAVVILGHPARGPSSEFSGSSAWENAVRMRWYMGPTLPDLAKNKDEEHDDPDPLVRYVAKRKANYSPQDWRRLTYQNGVLLADSADANGPRLDSMARREVARAVILKGLKKLIEIGIDTTPKANSPDFLPRKVIDMRFHEDHGKRDLSDALNSLLADGGIVINTVRGTDRHDRKVLRIGGQI